MVITRCSNIQFKLLPIIEISIRVGNDDGCNSTIHIYCSKKSLPIKSNWSFKTYRMQYTIPPFKIIWTGIILAVLTNLDFVQFEFAIVSLNCLIVCTRLDTCSCFNDNYNWATTTTKTKIAQNIATMINNRMLLLISNFENFESYSIGKKPQQ